MAGPATQDPSAVGADTGGVTARYGSWRDWLALSFSGFLSLVGVLAIVAGEADLGLILATAFFLGGGVYLGRGMASDVLRIGPEGLELPHSRVLVPWEAVESVVRSGMPAAGGGMLVLNIGDPAVRDEILAKGFFSHRFSQLRRLRRHLYKGQYCIPLNTWSIPGDEIVEAVGRYSGQPVHPVSSYTELRSTAPTLPP